MDQDQFTKLQQSILSLFQSEFGLFKESINGQITTIKAAAFDSILQLNN